VIFGAAAFPVDVAALADALPQIVWMTDAAGAVLAFNARWFAFTGRTPEQSYGDAWLTVLHPDDRERTVATWARCVGLGEGYEIEYRFRRADGVYRWQLGRGTAMRDDSGTVVRWFGTCTDIHDRKRAETSLATLSRIGDTLIAGFDEARMLSEAAALVVPTIAEWCFVFVESGNGAMRPAAVAHDDADRTVAAADVVRRFPPTTAMDVRGATTVIVEQEPFLTACGIGAAIVIPIRARRERFGAIVLGRADSAPFDAAEIAVFEILGKRFAVAIENARNFAREQTVAATFQRAALPKSLPEVPGLTLDAVYTAAAREAQVGGDWYDAFTLDDGRIVLSIGDVAGKGLDAAVVMAHVRQAIRVAALCGLDPAHVLATAGTALEREHADRMVTAFVGFYDAPTRTLAYASAGHPAPLLRLPDGSVEPLAVEAPPLGLGIATPPPLRTVTDLADGTLVALYTDGLIESTHDVLEGEERLRAAVRSDALLHTASPAGFIRDAVLHDGVRDDVAVLTLFVGRRAHWSFDASDAMAAHGARASFVRALRDVGTPGSDFAAAELIFGELVGNVVRHAPGRIEIDLVWSGDAPELHVLDRGTSFDLAAVLPQDVMQESGRGLFLVELLGENFVVDALPRRGNHVRVTLPVRRRIA
jgi:PAS domain S-box-containing protein